MKISIHKTKDLLTPDLKARVAKAKAPKKALEAMALAVVSLATRSFTQASARPATWAPLKPATIAAKIRAGRSTKPLIRTATMSQSPRVVRVTDKTATVGSDRRVGGESLAAIHQLGTKDGKIPARPFFPFTKDGKPSPTARRNIIAAAKASLALERK